MKQLERYTYTIAGNASIQIPAPNDNFIILSATGPLTVRGNTFGKLTGLQAGQGLKSVPFDRLEIVDESGAPNTFTILLSPAEFVNQIFSGAVDINAGSIQQLQRGPLATGNYQANSLQAAGSADPVFLAGANVNGALILHMDSSSWAASAAQTESYVAKATAPASPIDGLVQASSKAAASTGGGTFAYHISRDQPVLMPAGLGLYFVNTLLQTQASIRSCRYILL